MGSMGCPTRENDSNLADGNNDRYLVIQQTLGKESRKAGSYHKAPLFLWVKLIRKQITIAKFPATGT